MNNKTVRRLFTRKLPLLASILFSFYLFSFLTFTTFSPTNSTDSSWQYALSGLRHSDQRLGIDIFYTYGPLFEVMPTYVHARDTATNYIVGNLLFLFIVSVNVIVFLRLYRILSSYLEKKQLFIILLISLVSIVLTLTDVDTAFNLSLLATIFVANQEKNYKLKLLLLSAIYVLAYFKFSYLVPAILLTPLAFIKTIRPKALLKGIVESCGALLVCISIFFLLTHSLSVPAFGKYIYYSLVNTAAYGEFMGLPYTDFQSIIMAYLALFWLCLFVYLICLYKLFKKRRKHDGQVALNEYAILGLGFLIVTFFDMKHAIVRNDIHLLSFTPFIFLCFFFAQASIVTVLKKRSSKRVRAAYYSLAALLFISVAGHLVVLSTVTHSSIGSGLKKYARSTLGISKQVIINNRLNYRSFTQNRQLSISGLASRGDEVLKIRAKLANIPDQRSPIIFYGNTNLYGEILRQDRQILYTPFLQNYVAYPPTLGDDLYIDYLDKHPNALVFAEENEPSIDKRVPAHELNKFFQYLLHNYVIVASNNERRQYVFQRVSGIKESCKVLSTFAFKDNEVAPVPSLPGVGKQEYIKLSLNHDLSAAETIASLLIKNPVYRMDLITPEGVPMVVRTTRTTLEHGVAIMPFNQSLGDFANDKPFIMKSFILRDGIITTSMYTARIELCSYN